MTFSKLLTRSSLQAGLSLAVVAVGFATLTDRADAQCATCPQPVVAYSPVVAPVAAPQPVVLQTAQPTTGWYPGKYLSRIFRPFRPRPVAPTPTFVTAAYRPTFAPTAFATYSTVNYAPVVQTVASPIACGGCATSPCCCPQTVARPVTLTALSPCSPCATCAADGCCGATGVATAGYNAPVGNCPNCAGHAATTTPTPSPGIPPANFGNGGNGSLQPTPAPALPFDSQAPEQRVQRPENPGVPPASEGSGTFTPEGDDSTTWWDPPQLFDGRDRSASRTPSRGPTTNVWNAVYHRQANPQTRRTAYRPSEVTQASAARQQQRRVQVGASGWRSAD